MHDILIEEKILGENARIAGENRLALRERGVFAINLVSSPGAGKTSVIERTAPLLAASGIRLAVIEGDIATSLDSDRVSRRGVPSMQITTGRACHLDAHMISHALPWVFGLGPIGILIIENVGNMVCPAEYDLGEDMMVSVLSVTEGEDKPLKYPAIFSRSSAVLINKTDLAPHTDFDLGAARKNALGINPGLKIFEISCRSGAGIEEWGGYLSGMVKKQRSV